MTDETVRRGDRVVNETYDDIGDWAEKLLGLIVSPDKVALKTNGLDLVQ